MPTTAQKIAMLQESKEQLKLQEEVAKLYALIAQHTRATAEQMLQSSRGLSLKQIAQMDSLSYGTVRARVKEMQEDADFRKYVRDYGGYKNGTYKQCLRIDLEGWRKYGMRHLQSNKK